MDKKDDKYGICVDWDRLLKEHPERVPSVYLVTFWEEYPQYMENLKDTHPESWRYISEKIKSY